MKNPQKQNTTFYTIIALLFLLCVTMSMFWTYGTGSTLALPSTYKPEYLFGLIGIIFPILLIYKFFTPVRTKYREVHSDVAERWKRLRHKIINKSSIISFSKIRRYKFLFKSVRSIRSLYNTDFWITVLSTSKEKYLGFLGRFIILIWSFGWLLYYIAIWGDFDHVHTISGNLLYSAMSSFDLFLVDINGNIIDNIDLNWLTGLLVGLIGITSVCASLSLFSLVLGMFLTRLVIHLKGKEVEITPTSNNHIYIFFEKNDKSIAISESILEKDHRRGLVIFVECTELDDDDDDGWNNIVKVFSSQNRLRYDKIGYSNQIHLKSHVSIEDANEQCKNGILNLWDALGLPEIKERLSALSKLTPLYSEDEKYFQNEIHFFLLSDDRDKNVLHAKILSKYLSKDFDTQELPKTIHCLSRKDGVTSIVEDSCSIPDLHLDVKIIDDAHLSIDQLKKDPKSHPINFVDIDTQNNFGSIKSPFTSLIVGFGETGRDALRFVYEFAAFIDSNNPIPKRSPFKAYIIDENMDNLKGHFILNNPYIVSKINIEHNNGNLVEFCDYNDKSQQFYELLKAISPNLNYVVVAVGDDEANITLAVNILKMVRRYRHNLNHFKIYVRAYENSSFTHLKNIADRYNLTLASELVNDYSVIKIFGSTKEIYTYDTIIRDVFSIDAEQYFDAYKVEYNKTTVGLQYPSGTWADRRREALASLKQEKIDDLKRKEFQDRENALHKYTKFKILESVILANVKHKHEEKDRITATFIEKLFKLDPVTNKYREEKYNTPIEEIRYNGVANLYNFASILISNLAITEHLRWNASHEMLGYCYFEGCKKDTIRMTHNCLVPWDKLPHIVIASGGTIEENAKQSELVRLYDYLVVETSLRQMLSILNDTAESNANHITNIDRNCN